jgi:hypothetical protein
MKLKVLFIQRVESYGGEHAPEALLVTDEFSEAANPDYFADSTEMVLDGLDLPDNQIAGKAVVVIDVDGAEIRRLCCPPKGEAIKGKIVGSEPA